MPSNIRPALAAASLALLLSACRFHVSEQNFIRAVPDEVPSTASLAAGVEGVGETRLTLDTPDGARLHGVFLDRDDAELTVLYFGGNTTRLSRHGSRVAARLLPLGVDLIMADHRGSGASTGSPDVAALERDALQLYDHARDALGIDPSRLIVHGLSLGSFMAAHVASQRPVAGLVLEGSGTRADDWARRMVPWYAKPVVRVDVDPAIAGKGALHAVTHHQAPLLILTSRRDDQAPWRMSQALFDAATSPHKRLVVLDHAGHMDMLDAAEAVEGYRWLLQRVAGARPAVHASGFDEVQATP